MGVGVHRVEHAPAAARLAWDADEQALVDQAADDVAGRRHVAAAGDLGGGRQVEGAGETPQPAEECPLVGVEQVVALVDHGPERPVAPGRPAGEETKAVVETGEKAVHPE